ncbi:hypothetical protein [Kitasatospora sp. LaBMicrA B282]|uniref:hypothetical protein n=1 Tax=Kitasatospora sp. LaBMicrA B282 TaxID=3420949 RepID=UPI003D0B7D5E
MSVLELHVLISEDDVEDEYLDSRTHQLRKELLQLEVESVKFLSVGPPPAGAKGLDVSDVGTLVVVVIQTAAALQQLINTTRGWVKHGYAKQRTVVIKAGEDELKITGVDDREEASRIELFVARNSELEARP